MLEKKMEKSKRISDFRSKKEIKNIDRFQNADETKTIARATTTQRPRRRKKNNDV